MPGEIIPARSPVERLKDRMVEALRVIAGEQPSTRLSFPSHEIGETILEARDIRKTFPGVVANDGIDFQARAGYIHALLGENGAGKTTFVRILYGIYRPDGGHVYVDGREVDIRSPRDARDLGIGMVPQHFMLADPHSVAENVALGLPGGKILFPEEEVKERMKEYSAVYGISVPADAKVWQLSAGEKQKIEILRTLLAGARVIILDEPTSVLTPIEAAELFKAMRLMAQQGKTVIFITHKLEEVLTVCDDVTVLRKGRVVGQVKTSDASSSKLASMMVGMEIPPPPRRKSSPRSQVALQVTGLTVLGDRGEVAVKGVSFEVRSGEIVGIAGVAGNGQRELMEAIAGLRRAVSGTIVMGGVDVTNSDPRTIASLGVSYIPEDRVGIGVVPDMSVSENLILRSYWRPLFSKGLFLDRGSIEKNAEKMISTYGIMTPSHKAPVRTLSGGNIQRLILARETSGSPRVILASHPTSGLDVKAANDIRTLLVRRAEEGSSVLMNSEDLDEIFELSDRIAVMTRGEIVGILSREQATREKVGLLMGGAVK